jgi:hypothetical protein
VVKISLNPSLFKEGLEKMKGGFLAKRDCKKTRGEGINKRIKLERAGLKQIKQNI